MSSFPQTQITTPHFRVPFQFGGINGGALLNEQDTDEDIEDCVKVILAVPVGHRIDEPTFGTPDTLFQLGSDAPIAVVRSALTRWETRIAIGVEGSPLGSDEGLRQLTVRLGIFNA